MRQGVIELDQWTERMVIRFSSHEDSGKLHCGQPLEVFVNGEWKETRIGYNGGWILEGIECSTPIGLKAII